MKKTEAIQLAGSQCDLAKLLGITQAAVSQWGENVPMARLWQMKTLKPEWFDNQAVTINPQT
jgi:predicted transcriptional regulator